MLNSSGHLSLAADVFLTSPWIPAEFVSAHGLCPRPLLFAPVFGAGVSSPGAGVCAFAENALNFAEAAKVTGFAFTSHCDQLRRAFDAVSPRKRSRTFLFHLPVTDRAPVVQRLFRAELERFGKFLVELGGNTPTPEALAAEARRYGAARSRLRAAADCGGGRAFASALAEFHWNGAVTANIAPADSTRTAKSRLALVGGPLALGAALWGQVEATGGEIVLDATEWGERGLGLASAALAETEAAETDSPLDLLCRRFVDGSLEVFQRPNNRLYDWLGQKLHARGVQGIILWHYFGCDLWRAETQSLREAFGLPLLPLEADESGSDAERNANRIQAFVEALQ